MKRHGVGARIFVLLAALLSANALEACHRRVELTGESAQRTVTAWARQRGIEGAVKVGAIKLSEPVATADLEFKGWKYDWQGKPRTYSGSGIANFRQSPGSFTQGGTWILEKIMVLDVDMGTRSFPEFKPDLALATQ